MFVGGSVFRPTRFGRSRMSDRSSTVPALSAFAGLLGVTAWLAPERLCVAYSVAGSSFTQSPAPTGATYALPRVLSKPSPCDHETIARPIRRPRSVRLRGDVRRRRRGPCARVLSESARRLKADRVVGSPSAKSESSTVCSAATAVSVGSYVFPASARGSESSPFRIPTSGSAVRLSSRSVRNRVRPRRRRIRATRPAATAARRGRRHRARAPTPRPCADRRRATGGTRPARRRGRAASEKSGDSVDHAGGDGGWGTKARTTWDRRARSRRSRAL